MSVCLGLKLLSAYFSSDPWVREPSTALPADGSCWLVKRYHWEGIGLSYGFGCGPIMPSVFLSTYSIWTILGGAFPRTQGPRNFNFILKTLPVRLQVLLNLSLQCAHGFDSRLCFLLFADQLHRFIYEFVHI